MGLIINRTDFTGRYAIPQNSLVNNDVDLYIAKYEEEYLVDLLGVDLYDAFVTDFGLPSQSERFVYIEEPFKYDDEDCIVRSEGMLEMLKGFLYFHIVRDLKYKLSVTGHSTANPEIGREVSFDEANLYGRYNDAIKTYHAIQLYINDNSEDYTEFNGKPKTVVHWAL